MVTLNRVHGGSLVAGLNDAFDNMEKASIKQFGLDREKKDIDLLRQAQGLAPLTPPVQANNGNKKQRGFIRSISPQIADHIDGLNESRDVNGIDEVRNTAQMTIATARKILAAKTPAAKQKILLENAQKARKEGRDNTKMLKSAGMSPEQIDLQAQKALMVNEATLRTLPAPTGDERQAARSQLAIRNPQAYRMLVAEENARASKGQAAASKAQAAAKAQVLAEQGQKFDALVTGQPPQGEAAPQQERRMPAFSGGTGEIAAAGPQARGRNAGRTQVDPTAMLDQKGGMPVAARSQVRDGDAIPEMAALNVQLPEEVASPQMQMDPIQGVAGPRDAVPGYSLGDPGAALDFGAAGRVPLPQEAPAPVDMVQQAQDAYRASQSQLQSAVQLRDQIYKTSTDKDMRAMADAKVKEYEGRSESAFENIGRERDILGEQVEKTPLAQKLDNLVRDADAGLLKPNEVAAKRSLLVAEHLKNPDYQLLSADEAKARLGAGYDETKTYQVSPSNQVSVVGGGDITVNTGEGANKTMKLSERQSALVLFGSMMATTQPVFDVLEGNGFEPGGFAQWVATETGTAGNYFLTPEGRQYNAAKSAWSEGVLRIQTGAAATTPEVDRVKTTYFATAGDDAATVAFKRQLRFAYGEALGLGSGGIINPNSDSASAVRGKVAQGAEIISPAAFADIMLKRPDLGPLGIAAYFESLSPEDQKKLNDQYKGK